MKVRKFHEVLWQNLHNDRCYVVVPSGLAIYVSNAEKGRTLLMRTSPTGWEIHRSFESYDLAVRFYDSFYAQLTVPSGYYCIAKVEVDHKGTPEKWLCALPSIAGYIKEYGKLNWNLYEYLGTGEWMIPEGIEITQSLANAYVDSRKFKKKYYDDFVVVIHPECEETELGYVFTYQYGKYYFVGMFNKYEAREFKFRHTRQAIGRMWIPATFLDAVNALDNRRTIKCISTDAEERIFAGDNCKEWTEKVLSFDEVVQCKWFIKE